MLAKNHLLPYSYLSKSFGKKCEFANNVCFETIIDMVIKNLLPDRMQVTWAGGKHCKDWAFAGKRRGEPFSET